jgi:hypothetical protein
LSKAAAPPWACILDDKFENSRPPFLSCVSQIQPRSHPRRRPESSPTLLNIGQVKTTSELGVSASNFDESFSIVT